MLPLVVFLGGAINAVLGILGAMFCIIVSLPPKRSTVTKIILNIIITIFVWVVDLFMLKLALSAMGQ